MYSLSYNIGYTSIEDIKTSYRQLLVFHYFSYLSTIFLSHPLALLNEAYSTQPDCQISLS